MAIAANESLRVALVICATALALMRAALGARVGAGMLAVVVLTAVVVHDHDVRRRAGR